MARLVEHGIPVVVAGAADVRTGIQLDTEADVHPFVAPVALIQSFYPLVDAVARVRGRNPDEPPRLRKVTETV